MQYIEHITEPDRLLLSWQAPDRRRLIVAELRRSGPFIDLAYLSDSEEFRQAKDKGFEGYPGFEIGTYHVNVLDAFAMRLPPRSRSDYCRFLKALRIKEDAKDTVSDFALLGYSGARLPDDTFMIIHPFDLAIPPFELMVEVQGYRYYMDETPYESLQREMVATFCKEPENEFDSQAIAILLDGKRIGYVCQGLTESFHKWMDAGLEIKATLERINGTPERPLVFLYVVVREPK